MKKNNKNVKLAIMTYFLSFSTYSFAAGLTLSDQDCRELTAAIMVKNKIVVQQSDISNVNVRKNISSLAFEITNLHSGQKAGGNKDLYSRQVEFTATTDSEIRSYSCNLIVQVQGNDITNGTHLESCKYTSIGTRADSFNL